MWIKGFPLWLAQTNCFVVAPDGPGGECVIVDVPPDPTAVLQFLAEHELRPKAIFATHGHVDHIGGIGTVVHEHEHGHELDVRIHRHDRFMLEDVRGTSGSFARYLDGLDLRPPEIIGDLDDGDEVRGAGMTFRCLHTPGHTMGSVCLTLQIDAEQPVLFSGDHLFAGSIGRTDLPGGSYEALMQSMASKIMPLDDAYAVLPGHGPITTIGRERLTNPFLIELQQDITRWE
jgi:hydroxyacylglutathione hydrolase